MAIGPGSVWRCVIFPRGRGTWCGAVGGRRLAGGLAASGPIELGAGDAGRQRHHGHRRGQRDGRQLVGLEAVAAASLPAMGGHGVHHAT